MPRRPRFSRLIRVISKTVAVVALATILFYVSVGPKVLGYALRKAASMDSPILVRALLFVGADLNPRYPNKPFHGQGSALDEAVGYRHDALAAYLLDHGADPGIRDHNDETALGLAASNGDLRLVDLLLRHGADPNAPGRCGTMPLDHADYAGSPAVILRLEKAGGRRAHKDGCG